LVWYAHPEGETVRGLNGMWVEGDRLARVRNCFYTPDVLAEVCGELNVPFRSNRYRRRKPTSKRGHDRVLPRAARPFL
jgi:hypothetical protein